MLKSSGWQKGIMFLLSMFMSEYFFCYRCLPHLIMVSRTLKVLHEIYPIVLGHQEHKIIVAPSDILKLHFLKTYFFMFFLFSFYVKFEMTLMFTAPEILVINLTNLLDFKFRFRFQFLIISYLYPLLT